MNSTKEGFRYSANGGTRVEKRNRCKYAFYRTTKRCLKEDTNSTTQHSSGCLVSELDWPRSDPSFQVRRQSPVIVHSAAHMGWAIIRVRFDLGTHLMNTIRLHWVLKPQNSRLWYKTVNDWVDQWCSPSRTGR